MPESINRGSWIGPPRSLLRNKVLWILTSHVLLIAWFSWFSASFRLYLRGLWWFPYNYYHYLLSLLLWFAMVLAILQPHWLFFFPTRIQQFTAVTGCEVSRVHQTSDARRKFEAHVRAGIDVITHWRPDHSTGALNYFTIIIQNTIPHRLNLISPLAPPPPLFQCWSEVAPMRSKKNDL